jgi:sialate O-acetylesterase
MQQRAVIAALLATWTATASATVRLPHILSDHMVLQSGPGIPIWGQADPGEPVLANLDTQTRRTRADAQGRWQVTFDLSRVGPKPLVLTVTGAANTVTVSDVLVGESWLASGQSNMEKPLRNQRGQKDVFDADKELAAANHPRLRLFKVNKASAATTAADVEGEWVACTPESLDAQRFSAAA